jgi:PleD family two-component response regulator
MSRSIKALGEEVRMTISLGVTTMRDGEALSQAKASGKNRAELA